MSRHWHCYICKWSEVMFNSKLLFIWNQLVSCISQYRFRSIVTLLTLLSLQATFRINLLPFFFKICFLRITYYCFLWNTELQKKERTLSTGLLPEWWQPELGQLEARNQESGASFWSPTWVKGPEHWAILHYFPRSGAARTWTRACRGCWHHRWSVLHLSLFVFKYLYWHAFSSFHKYILNSPLCIEFNMGCKH